MARPNVLLLCLFAAALLAVSSGCKGEHSEPLGKPPVVTVSTAQREPITEIVTGEAELFAWQQASLSPKISSPIERYLVERGQAVRKGQLLAVLENRDLAAAVGASAGEVEQAQANYAATTAATVPQQLQKAESDVESAKATLDAQQKLYDNRAQLFKQGAIAGKEVDQGEVALIAARTQYKTARKVLQDFQATIAGTTRQSAAGQLASARARKIAAEVQLRYSELRSPIDGVVAFRNLYPGDIAPAGTPLVVVMNLSQIVAKLHLPQAQAARLAIGDPATLTAENIDPPLSGKVSLLSPALDPASTTSEVWVTAPNPHGQLHPGGSAKVSIVAHTVPDAIVVPASAILTQDDGSTTVLTLKPDNTVVLQKVQVGIQQGAKVQILSGVSRGQSIVSGGGYGLPEGTKVEPSADGSQPDKSQPAQGGPRQPAS